MTETAVATVPQNGAALAEQVVVKGNLAGLTEQERMTYYSAVCDSLGLNPLTRPFEYITLNGKLTLYATRAATDQLRSIRGITITSLDPRQVGDLFVVVATGRDRTGREDSSTGAVTTAGLRGEALANAMMKAETKAKRRLTLSLAGLGMTDETEVDSIPDAVRQDVPHLTLAEKAAEKRRALSGHNHEHGEPCTASCPPAIVVDPTPQEAASEPSDETELPDGQRATGEGDESSPVAPIGRLALFAAIKELGLPETAVVERSNELYPGIKPKDMTDDQRGEVLASLRLTPPTAALGL